MSEYQRLIGHEEWSNRAPRTQVYLDTHDGADRRLPHRERSFISFTYGGKHIEDFYLIATLRNSRMERQLYGNFSDNVSTYEVIDGQFYWGSHYTTNRLELQLSTDEMTEQQLQDFKAWFTPGEGKELILAEYPNRAIWARVSKAPVYHMLPFEKQVEKTFAKNTYMISTTVYRGDIDIEFTMDDPFWYSIYNVLPSYGQDGAEDWFKTLGVPQINNSAIENSLMANKDYLKIILEDGVPTKEMIKGNIITGNATHNSSKIYAVGYKNNEKVGNAKVGARIGSISLTLNANSNNLYLYYTGSAPAPTIITFSITPKIQDNGYIKYPCNKIYNEIANDSSLLNYNMINVGKKQFKFTTPSLYTGYNQAMKIISAVPEGTSTIDLHILLTEGVNEYYSRSWALGILNYLKAFQAGIDLETSQIINLELFQNSFKNMMKQFLQIETGGTEDNLEYEIMPATFSFNSKTGVSTGKFKIRKFTEEGLDQWEKINKYKGQWNVRIKLRNSWFDELREINNNEYELEVLKETIGQLPNDANEYYWLLLNAGFDMLDKNGNYLFTVKPFIEYTEEADIEENVGDMVYGKYLYLEEKNLYDNQGEVTAEVCTPISTDYPADLGLNNFDIQYKYMYL